MEFNNRISLTISYLFSALFSFSQVDSMSKPEFKRLNDLLYGTAENHLSSDTLLDQQFNYFLKDFNGGLALPSSELLLENKFTEAMGVRYFKPNYRSHLFDERDILFHQAKKPYTRAFALAGMRQEQILKLIHTQNIRRLNYSILFNRYKSVGFYKNQLGTVDNFISTVSYASKKGNYSMNSWFLFNKLKHQENGGIENSEEFDSLFRENKELLQVNLLSAKRITRNLNAGVVQFFDLRRGVDSVLRRSLIFHKLQFNSDFFIFSDDNPASGYFPVVLYDSLKTKDSTILNRIRNTVGYVFRNKHGRLSWEWNLFYLNEISNLKQTYANGNESAFVYTDTILSNHFAGGGLSVLTEKSRSVLKTEYIFSGCNQNNFSISMFHSRKLPFKGAEFEVRLEHENRNTDWFYNRFKGNHHQWLLNLSKVSTSRGNFMLSLVSGKLFLLSQNRAVNGLIYFNSPDVPLQISNTVFMSANSLGTKLKYRSFRFENRLTIQYTNFSSLISLPPIHLQSLLFYDAVLFSGNLHLQTGIQLNYYSSFQSNAYMPSLNSYYTQGRREVGNYPFVDFFINAEIKPVRFFVLVDHMNQGLSGPNYLLTPNYPMADRSIKFGFTWLFWD